MLLLTGVYGGLAGYRWAAFSQEKHDIDIIFGLIAISISLLGIAMTPLVAFIAPLNTLNDAGFPLTPFMAGLLLICQSLLMLFRYRRFKFISLWTNILPAKNYKACLPCDDRGRRSCHGRLHRPLRPLDCPQF